MWNDFHFGHLVLTDIDEGVLRTMRDRFGTETNDDDDEASEASGDGGGGVKRRTVRCVTCDARDMSGVGTASCAVVVDKGTLDALSGDDHKTAMLRECARICDFANGGIIVSVSFAAAARVALLRATSDALGLDVVTRVVGDGDPKYGGEAVFVSVLGRGLWDVAGKVGAVRADGDGAGEGGKVRERDRGRTAGLRRRAHPVRRGPGKTRKVAVDWDGTRQFLSGTMEKIFVQNQA